MLEITQSISLEDDELDEQFIRAPGSGGQKVNKTASAVQLRFFARKSPALSNAVFLRLKALAGRRMAQNGDLIITATQFRTQEQNRRDARDRLVALIRQALVPPRIRRATKPTLGSKHRRLDGKKRQSGVKKTRGKVNLAD
ncbi:MAG: aminoacyl-tRNA hydrolase [Rhodospirillales bacterium]|nr:aminoacyl-tRNA hydrolase [Rhodospirillales bacterium]